jgi:hypothetical protein
MTGGGAGSGFGLEFISHISTQFSDLSSQHDNFIKGDTAMDFVSKLLQGIAFVPAVVSGIEKLFGSRSGAEKKDAALSFIQAALSMTDAITNRQIVDEPKFKDGLSKVIDGTVQCLNASIWAKTQ